MNLGDLGVVMNLRHEYKYLLDYRTYLQLSSALKKVMRIDSNTVNKDGYHIRSLYFDDMYDTALNEKIIGVLNRKKYRIRIYDFSEKKIKLEEKIKHHDYIQKNSCTISKQEYNRILTGDVSFLHGTNETVKENYYLAIRNRKLAPKVIVDYMREAYILPYNQIRITFDKQLSVTKPNINIFDSELPSNRVGGEYDYILEVKYNNFLPNHIKQILGMYCNSRLAVSKYLLCRGG